MDWNVSEDLVQSPPHKQSGLVEMTFDGLLHPPLKLYEDLAEGCGGQLWPAGVVLAKYLIRRCEELLRNASIVELGAGGGLVGIAVGLSQKGHGSSITRLTDQKQMLALMQRNISLNHLEARVSASILNWGDAVPADVPHPDIVLAADCVYFEPAFPLLQQTLDDLLGENTVCYFCFKKRRRADVHFINSIRKRFEVKEVDDDPDRVVYRKQNVFLYKITRKKTV